MIRRAAANHLPGALTVRQIHRRRLRPREVGGKVESVQHEKHSRVHVQDRPPTLCVRKVEVGVHVTVAPSGDQPPVMHHRIPRLVPELGADDQWVGSEAFDHE